MRGTEPVRICTISGDFLHAVAFFLENRQLEAVCFFLPPSIRVIAENVRC